MGKIEFSFFEVPVESRLTEYLLVGTFRDLL